MILNYSVAFSAIRNKYEDAGVLIAAAPKDYLSSITMQRGPLGQDMLVVTVKEIVKEMLDMYHMQKVRNVKSENDDDDDDDEGEVMLTNIEKNFKGICYVCRKK